MKVLLNQAMCHRSKQVIIQGVIFSEYGGEEVGVPISVFRRWFSPVLQRVTKRCQAAKSLCHVCLYSGCFSSMLSTNASVVVDSNLRWYFPLVWAAHYKLNPAEPPKAEQKLRTIDIRLCCRCWCIAKFIPRFSTLRVIVVYPLSIAGHDKT